MGASNKCKSQESFVPFPDTRSCKHSFKVRGTRVWVGQGRRNHPVPRELQRSFLTPQLSTHHQLNLSVNVFLSTHTNYALLEHVHAVADFVDEIATYTAP